MSKISISGLLAVTASFWITGPGPVFAEDAPTAPAAAPVKAESLVKPAGSTVEGWGKVADPDGDCKVTLKDEVLSITVAPTKPHDLAPEIQVTNAPRVLQAVEGDFSIRVKVEGGYEPGGETTSNQRVAYNGAALIIMADPENVITLARAVMQREGFEPRSFANFEMRSQGRLLQMGSALTKPLPAAGPIWLKLERRGSEVSGAVSKDGEKWESLESKEIPETWPKALQTGVAGISTSVGPFEAKFTKLHLEK